MRLAHRSQAPILAHKRSLKHRPHQVLASRHPWLKATIDALTPYLLAAAVLFAYHEGMFV